MRATHFHGRLTASADATHDGDYTLTATATSGCTASGTVNVTVNTPVIATSGTLSAFSACDGVNSSEQNFTVSGQYLTNDIVVTPPTGYEVSTSSGASFASSVTLSPTSYTVNSTTIYARLKSGLYVNNYSGNITCSTTSGSNQTIALSGTHYNGENSSVNYYVDDSGSDSNHGLTDSAPFATLTQAISTATSGTATIINVGAGTYTEHTVNVNKSNLTIRGAGSSSTIFDCNTTNKGFMSITASTVTVEKIKIKDYNFTSALESDVTWVHQDSTDWSGVLYLTPNAPIDSGTLFFKEGSEPDPDKDDYGDYIVDHIGNIYNRMLLFRGHNLPHRSNIAGFGDCLENGRLSQHFFFNEVK